MKDRQEIAIDIYRICPNDFLYHEDYLAAADILIKLQEENEKKYKEKHPEDETIR